MWPFSSPSAEAGPSTPQSSTPVEALSSAPAPAASSASTPTAPTLNRWDRTIADEQAYQAKIYPTTEELPTCMTLFDEFLMCYALGPQLRNIYRHGTYRDCSWKWADFKFCLSLKAEDMEDRKDLWIRRRAEYWAKRRVGASSEDVWNLRDKPIENFPPRYADDVPVDTPM